MAKADMACSSARVLLDLGDVDGAANRAYYAMFDAARAALLASGAPVEPDIGRTHKRKVSLGASSVKTSDRALERPQGRLADPPPVGVKETWGGPAFP
ncbi:HEPN domain-containing protein [Thiomonas sp.]